MALVPRLRDLLLGPKASPKSKVAAGDKDPLSIWLNGAEDRDFKHMKELGDVYRRGGPVSQAIRVKANFVFSNGYRIEGEFEEINDMIEERLDELSLEIVGPQAIIDAQVYGDCFHELARGSGAMSGRIVAQVPRSPETFRIDHDEHGIIERYVQVLKKKNAALGDDEEIPFKLDEVFHFSLENLGGSVYGTSLIDQAWNDIHWDAEIAKSTAEAIKRHGYPRFQIRVGGEGEDVPEKTLRQIDAQFRNLNSKQEFVTTRDVEIANIDQIGQGNSKLYGEWATMRLCTALGVPEELMGLGRGSTEATANVKLRAFYDDISALQKRFARAFNQQVIDQLTPKPGMCKLVFNEVNPKDQAAIAEWLAKMMAATPIDPFAIVPRKYAQDLLGIVESDWDEDDYVGEPNDDIGASEDDPEESSDADKINPLPNLEDPSELSSVSPRASKALAGTHEGACKAAKARGDKPGAKCGGGKKAPAEKGAGSEKKTAQPKTAATKLPENVRAHIDELRKDRAKLGRPAHNHRLGKSGEAVAQALLDGFKAHSSWNDADDLSNGFLMDVKTLNPNSQGTPIYANKIRRKLERSEETGKKWKFPLLHVQEDSIDVYINTPPEEFYSGDMDYYMANIADSELIGFIDAEGTWHKGGRA